MTSTVPLYRLENLTYRYGNHFELAIPELTIAKGSSMGFAGSNGSGKSTLLRLLAFIDVPEEGAIYYDGVKVTKNNGGFKRDVTMLLQEPYLLKRSVYENVAFGLKVRKASDNIRKRVREAMELVGMSPKEFARRKWHELSGGEAQRIALASRLVLRPKVLILDEPTASVDRQSAFLIRQAITKCRSDFGMALIIASHDRVWLNSVTDTVKLIHEGRIVGAGSENIISGLWKEEGEGLFSRILPDGQTIRATKPPRMDAAGIVNPSDIVLAVTQPEGVSAQNILHGIILHMTMENDTGNILVDVDVAGLTLVCRLTRPGVEALNLMPGKEVWTLFKASSVKWY